VCPTVNGISGPASRERKTTPHYSEASTVQEKIQIEFQVFVSDGGEEFERTLDQIPIGSAKRRLDELQQQLGIEDRNFLA
jgi:hypothetical protein